MQPPTLPIQATRVSGKRGGGAAPTPVSASDPPPDPPRGGIIAAVVTPGDERHRAQQNQHQHGVRTDELTGANAFWRTRCHAGVGHDARQREEQGHSAQKEKQIARGLQKRTAWRRMVIESSSSLETKKRTTPLGRGFSQIVAPKRASRVIPPRPM